MKRILIQIGVVLAVLIAVGALMWTPQQALSTRMQAEGLIDPPLDHRVQRELGQTGAAVALGGLRSLIASSLNLSAYSEFESQNWSELEKIFNMIVTLQPKNAYYWDTGAWHFAYNAYFDYEDKYGVAPARRRQKQKEYREKGEAFLLRGTQALPEEELLWRSLGRLYSDPHKPYDFAKAAAYFEQAVKLEGAKPRMKREYFYTLGRVKGREREAWELGVELMTTHNNRNFSSMRSLFFTHCLIQNPILAKDDRLIQQVFGGNKKLAYKDLANYWVRSRTEGFPQANLERVIRRLAAELDIPPTQNPFLNKDLKRVKKI